MLRFYKLNEKAEGNSTFLKLGVSSSQLKR